MESQTLRSQNISDDSMSDSTSFSNANKGFGSSKNFNNTGKRWDTAQAPQTLTPSLSTAINLPSLFLYLTIDRYARHDFIFKAGSSQGVLVTLNNFVNPYPICYCIR
jgi:hypothetical protein